MSKLHVFFNDIKTRLANLSRSISFRVALVSLIIFIVMIFEVIIASEYSFKKQLSENISPFLDTYVHQLESTLGNPVTKERALEFVKNNHLDLMIKNETMEWTSCASIPEIKDVEIIVKKIFGDGHNVAAGFYQGRLFMRVNYSNQNKTLLLTKHTLIKTSIKDLLFVNSLIIFLCLSLLVALVFLYLVCPIKKIQRGLKRIGDGEVSYRLSITRKDEIGQLSQSINQMASSIEGMLDSKREMVLGISHELRSPLTRIKLMLSLSDDSSIKEALIEEFDKMEMVIEELLESERIKEGHALLALDSISVNDLISQIQARFFEYDSIKMNLGDNLSRHNLDGNKMALVIKCVISNALSARKNKQDDINVSTYYEKDKIVIKIKDSGVGILTNDMKNIFEPFYRFNSENSSSYAGLGIGLYLTKKIIEAHKGSIEIESEENKGTTVRIVLPKNLS